MTWRTVVISQRAKLDLQLGYMVVRGEKVTKVHLSEISNLIIETTEVSLTAALLAAMVEAKIKVVFCDTKRNPCAEIMSYYGAHDTSIKVRKQVLWTDVNKGNVGTAILNTKVRMQATLLALLEMSTAEMLLEYASQIEFRDKTNREGHAAKVYFNSLFGVKFTRADDCPLNAALNYGYALILATCNREIAANGYITQLGLIHDNMYNQFNLGSDFMEPLRPFVDRFIYNLWKNDRLSTLDTETKHEILRLLQQEVILEGKTYVLDYAIRLYCRSLFEALEANDISLIKWCYFKDFKL